MSNDVDRNTPNVDALLPAHFMKKLERFRMCSRVVHPGASMGERVSRSRGSGMEFADHKEYSPGDDFRMIDWNVYARLDQFVVKVFETEENLSVAVILDASASMDFGAVRSRPRTRTPARDAAPPVDGDARGTHRLRHLAAGRGDAAPPSGGLFRRQ